MVHSSLPLRTEVLGYSFFIGNKPLPPLQLVSYLMSSFQINDIFVTSLLRPLV